MIGNIAAFDIEHKRKCEWHLYRENPSQSMCSVCGKHLEAYKGFFYFQSANYCRTCLNSKIEDKVFDLLCDWRERNEMDDTGF